LHRPYRQRPENSGGKCDGRSSLFLLTLSKK
jgi:hypothetical protein